MEIKTSSKFVAELIGTFGLVLFGCGAAVVAGANSLGGLSGLGLLGISLAFGLAVLVVALLGAFVLQQLLHGQLNGFTAGEWAYGSNGWGIGYQNGYGMATGDLLQCC